MVMQKSDRVDREIERIARAAERVVERENHRAGQQLARRDVHAKHHGCVWAYFDLDFDGERAAEDLRTGLFARKNGHYLAWVRFSNSSKRRAPDVNKDGRGCAIKLLEVEQAPQGVHDFVLLNHSAFFARDVRDMAAIAELQAEDKNMLRYFWAPTRWLGLFALYKLGRQIDSPLTPTYFSQLPYKLGTQTVKYRLRPRAVPPADPSEREKQDGNHLAEVLRRQLQPTREEREQVHAEPPAARPAECPKQPTDVVFDFEVQRKRWWNPLENASVPWVFSGFHKVAELRIPRQDFDGPERSAFAENIKFSPHHARREHEPVGTLNRARKVVYERVSRLRHQLNGVGAPACTRDEWYAQRRHEGAAPGSRARTFDPLPAVLSSMSKEPWHWLLSLLSGRLAPWVAPVLLALILLGLAVKPLTLGGSFDITAPLTRFGFDMPSERAIPPAIFSPALRDTSFARDLSERKADPRWLFRYFPVGSEFGSGLPYWIYRVLPSITPELFEGRGWSSVGLDPANDPSYYQSYHQLPRGLVLSDTIVRFGNNDFSLPLKRVSLNCASCHRGEYTDSDGNAHFVDGMPNHRFDAAAFKSRTLRALTDPRFEQERVIRAIEQEIGAQTGDARYRLTLVERQIYALVIAQSKRSAKALSFDWAEHRPRNGPGRLDAFGTLRFEFLGLGEPARAAGVDADNCGHAIATVDLPSIWQQGSTRPLHHYDGNTADPASRNLGAIVGIGGSPLSIRAREVESVGLWIDELKPPRYPFALADESEREAGRQSYLARCASCHGEHDARGVLTKRAPCMDRPERGASDTDAHRLEAIDGRFVERLNQFGQRNGVWPATAFDEPHGYLCPPLDGIWARAPYLHNGSVPTLSALLSPGGERPVTFTRGNTEYDRELGGFVDAPPAEGRSSFVYDTREPGNSNRGHESAEQVVDDPRERRQLVQYLLSL